MRTKFYTPCDASLRSSYGLASSNFVCPGIDPSQEFVEVPPSVAEITKLYSEVRLENFLSAVSAWLRFAAIKPEINDTKDHQSILTSLVTRLEDDEVKPSLEVVGNLVKALELYSNENVLNYCSHDVYFFILCVLRALGELSKDFLDSSSRDLLMQIKNAKAEEFIFPRTENQLEMIKSLEEFLRERPLSLLHQLRED